MIGCKVSAKIDLTKYGPLSSSMMKESKANFKLCSVLKFQLISVHLMLYEIMEYFSFNCKYLDRRWGNLKIGQEELFNQPQGTKDEVINDALLRFANFVTSKNLTVILTDMPHSSSLDEKL